MAPASWGGYVQGSGTCVPTSFLSFPICPTIPSLERWWGDCWAPPSLGLINSLTGKVPAIGPAPGVYVVRDVRPDRRSPPHTRKFVQYTIIIQYR